MAFPIASRRSVSFPRGTRVTYVTWDVFETHLTYMYGFVYYRELDDGNAKILNNNQTL